MLFFARNMLLMLCVCIVATGCGSEPAALTAPTAQQARPQVRVHSATLVLPTSVSVTNVPATLVVASHTSIPATNLPASPTIIASPPATSPSPKPPVATALVAVATPAPDLPTAAPATHVPASPTIIASSAPPAPSPAPLAPPAPVPTALVAVEPSPASEPPTGLRYAFPVRSSGKISYGKYHHDYPATDIFCPIGSEFVAPTSGVVDWISAEDTWDPATDDPAVRGGRSVAIIGDDGVRYYGSHLSAIADGLAVGQRVEAGQVLGLTGNSGDARSTPSHLHFGISHPTTPDDWKVRRGEISPFPYLNAWRNGEMIRPDI